MLERTTTTTIQGKASGGVPPRGSGSNVPSSTSTTGTSRSSVFGELLGRPVTETTLGLLGELMRGSHISYTRCGLGSTSTDLLVQLVLEAGPAAGLYGAKITGGGSGGTVCVLGSNTEAAERSFELVLERYRALSGHLPYVVSGSSLGAVAFGSFEVSQHKTGVDAYKAACEGTGQGGAKGSKRRR